MPKIPFSFDSHHNLAAHTLIFDFPSSESYSRTVNEGVKNNQAGTRFNLIQQREGEPAREGLLAACSHSQLTVLRFKLCIFSNSILKSVLPDGTNDREAIEI